MYYRVILAFSYVFVLTVFAADSILVKVIGIDNQEMQFLVAKEKLLEVPLYKTMADNLDDTGVADFSLYPISMNAATFECFFNYCLEEPKNRSVEILSKLFTNRGFILNVDTLNQCGTFIKAIFSNTSKEVLKRNAGGCLFRDEVSDNSVTLLGTVFGVFLKNAEYFVATGQIQSEFLIDKPFYLHLMLL